jgi:peroxiredoxin
MKTIHRFLPSKFLALAVALCPLTFVTSSPAADSMTAGEKPMMPAAPMDMMPGLKVGDRAPDFTLKNAAGHEVALRDLLAKGNVALAFVRSADWCPFCRKQLQDLQGSLEAIRASGVQLIALSYDSPDTNAKAAAKLGLTFPLLSDPGSKTIDAYGIRNREATGRAAGVPHPTLFILDRQGVIRAKLMRDGYKDRPEPAELIAAAKKVM